ncbi:hypothetical protein ACLB1E_18370 [Escherichia coli]
MCMELAHEVWLENTQPMLSHMTSARALTALSASWRKPSPKWWVTRLGGFDASNRMVRRANCWM